MTEETFTNVEFFWKIKNFSLLSEREKQFVESPNFFPSSSEISFTLKLCPRYERNCISCGFELSNSLENIFVHGEFSIVGADGSIFLTENVFHPGNKVLCKREDIMKMRDQVLPNDTLTILTNVKFRPEILNDALNMSLDFNNLYKTAEFADLILNVNDESFPVHRFMLKSRAQDFWELLSITDEKQIKLKNMCPEMLNSYLMFIYSGYAGKCTAKMLSDLHEFSEKHNLRNLRKKLTMCPENSAVTNVNCRRKVIKFLVKNLIVDDPTGEHLLCDFVVDLEFVQFVPVFNFNNEIRDLKIILKHMSVHSTNAFLSVEFLFFGLTKKHSICRTDHWVQKHDTEILLNLYTLLDNDIREVHMKVAATDGSYTHEFDRSVLQGSSDVWHATCFFSQAKETLSLFNSTLDCFPDATIQVDTHSLRVHRAILSARSPVFAAMFRNNTQESITGIVKIEDVKYSVMKDFLQYIYTGMTRVNIKDTGEILLLFAVADKYQVSLLKGNCKRLLEINLSIYDVCEILQFANMVNDLHLLSFAGDFICSHWSDVSQSPNWKKIEQENPALAYQIVRPILHNYKF